jgi:hypothetical protein
MRLGGEGPRGYEELGVAVKCVILTPLFTNWALAVEALPLPVPLPLPMITADPAVEAVNLAATELTAAPSPSVVE